MKTKFAGLASTALLLLAPISGAFSAVAESQVVQAENNWDYDTANPGLGEYDRLLQNAGPSDGQIDWYPAEHFASSKNIRPSLLVKQLIDLSIATNNANSNARKVLFNDTTGTSQKSDYQDTYSKYNLAFGFIAQLLAFNNEKTGQGAYLKQGFESEDGENPGGFHSEDTIAETQKTPDPAILGIPAIGEGINISDVLGRAFFGNADDAYAQLYVNGYDNTVQNAPNIIRETTTSITIVAQSKLTGRKATAIFKLNNKTFNNLPDGVLLENKIDNSPSFAGSWGNKNIPDGEEKNLGDSTDGTFNQRTNLVTGLTDDQKRLLSNGGSSAWVDPKTGSGTIVVPRGTSAAEIAKKIKQLGYKSNYNISNVAPMKAIHGDKYNKNDGSTSLSAVTDKNSYNVNFGGVLSDKVTTPLADPKGNITALSNDSFDNDGKKANNYLAITDPRLTPTNSNPGYDTSDPIFGGKNLLDKNFSNSLLYNPLNTNDSRDYSNSTAATIPNQISSAIEDNPSPFNQPIDNSTSSYNWNESSINAGLANEKLGNVVHAFEPKENAPTDKMKSPFMVREAWDDTHAIFGTAPFTGLTEEEIKNQIANNGSFNNTSGDQIKKSFTFNMPLNNSVMKSYRNPYSTVISTALPFAEGNTAFNNTEHYTADKDMNISGFTGKYDFNSPTEKPLENKWYVNPGESYTDSADGSGQYQVKINGDSSTDRTAQSLHLDSNTWRSDNVYYDKNDYGDQNPGIYNSKNGALKDMRDWVTGSLGSTLTGQAPRDEEESSAQLTSQADNTDYPSKIDAHNEDQFISPRKRHWEQNLPPYIRYSDSVRDRDSINWPNEEGNHSSINHSSYNHVERHLQLAKNIGYILINAQDISEKQQVQLRKYQLPKSTGTPNELNWISNKTDYTTTGNLPMIYPVDDDPYYRGGLLGSMSITGPEVDGDGSLGTPIAQKESSASSIYNNRSANKYLQAPTKDNSAKANHYKVHRDGNINSPFAHDTKLHYGLAWNDSSDLPQVKIERRHNAQYLVPVSISRVVQTTWHQDNSVDIRTRSVNDSSVIGWHSEYYHNSAPSYKRKMTVHYSDYKLFIGDVHLGDKSDGDIPSPSDDFYAIKTDSIKNPDSYNWIDEQHASLKDLLPVNNQIFYNRVDNSYPHYDSELFDHGSNRDDVTVTHGGLLTRDPVFVGNTEEKDSEKDTNSKYVGSSDDYSIGIVKAPSFLKRNGATGELEYKGHTDFTRDTENGADGKDGMNPMADTPENNNGMAIRDPKSYATLAQAYNVEINGNKAVGKADDNAKNKGDRVALVQQLLDNGGNAEAYYYIPSLPRLYEHWNEARINVVVYDKAAVPAPSKAETKPSFSTTDVSTGNDPFNVNLRPYTTVYDDGAVLKASDVPQNFKNLLTRELVAGNADLVNSDGQVATEKLQQILVGAFLNSWQQNDGSFNQTDTGVGVNSPLYLYGGFGISNSDSKNSYSQWPDGYTTPNLSSSKYHEAVTNYPGDFYRGGKDLKTTGATVIKGIPATALKADVSKVDLSKAGTYPVVYTYTNPSNDKDSASITVPVVVTDGAAPVFAFQGGSDLTIKVGESFDRSAFKVVGSWQIFNKYQGDYDKLVNYEGIAKNSKGEPDVTISGDVDTQTPGIYQLTYKATSTGGAVTTMNRNITVLPKETTGSDWKVSDFASVGYINYVPNYGINVWNAPAGTFTGQRLTHGTSWKIFQKAVNSQGKVYYQVGKNQWIDGAYVSFTPVSALQPLNGIVTINYVRGYGVNLWKAPKTTGGYYEGRKLQHGTKWKVFGIQDGFYKVGGNQWIQAKYAKFQTR